MWTRTKRFIKILRRVIVVTFLANLSAHCYASEDQLQVQKATLLKGSIEIMSLGNQGITDTPSHYWSEKAVDFYKEGDLAESEKAFQHAVDEIARSKLSGDQKALLIANLAVVKRDLHEFPASEGLFHKSLDLFASNQATDYKVHSYVLKQFAWLQRLEGKDSDASFTVRDADNLTPGPSLLKATGGKLSGMDGLQELKSLFGGLEISNKIEPLPAKFQHGHVINDSSSKKNSEYFVWHRVPNSLAGDWNTSDTAIRTRQEDLRTGELDINPANLILTHGTDCRIGVQADAKGDIWDFGSYPRYYEAVNPLPGERSRHYTSYCRTISTDQNSICILTNDIDVRVSANDNTIIETTRSQSVTKIYSVDKNSVGSTVVEVKFDDNGVPIARRDYISSKQRAADFVENKKWRKSFCDFLKAKNYFDLIPVFKN